VQWPVSIVVGCLQSCSVCWHKKAENLDRGTNSTSNVQWQCPVIVATAKAIGWKQLGQGLKVIQREFAKRQLHLKIQRWVW